MNHAAHEASASLPVQWEHSALFSTPMPHVAQLEFFLIRADSIEDLMKECEARTRDALELTVGGVRTRPAIKCVLRLYDTDGSLTQLASGHAALTHARQSLHKQCALNPRMRGWRGWLLNLRLKRVVRKLVRIHEQACDHSREVALMHLTEGMPVGIETYEDNRSFRMVHADERHEVAESLRRARNVWLFIYPHHANLRDAGGPLVAYKM